MLKKILKNTLIFLITVFCVVYFCIQVKNIFIDDMQTEYATLATMEDTVELKAYIIRDETVIESDINGTYNYNISEGERLSKGQTIADIYHSDSEFKAQEHSRELDSKIQILNESSVESNYFTLNVAKIDENIVETITEFREKIQSGDYTVATQKKNDLLITLNKRYLVVNALKSFNDLIEEYKLQKKQFAASSDLKKGVITAKSPGYFYSEVDGFENILTPEFIKDATPEQMIDVIDAGPEKVSEDAVGKLVYDFNWFTACIVDKETATKFNSGSNYNISYPYSVGTVIKSSLKHKTADSDGDDVLLVFESSNNTESFNYMRSQMIEVSLGSYSGLRIKKSALRIVNGYEGVFVLNGNTVEFKRANKVYENDGYYIITVEDPLAEYINSLSTEEFNNNPLPPYLRMYDSVINNGKELYDGKIIG